MRKDFPPFTFFHARVRVRDEKYKVAKENNGP